MKSHSLRLLKKRKANASDTKSSHRRSIAHKLMSMALCISLATIVLATFVCLYALKKVQNTAISDSISFGDNAANKSKAALLMSYAEFLDNTVSDKANIATEKFYSYIEDIEYTSVYISEILAHPDEYRSIPVVWEDELPEGFDSIFMTLCNEDVDYDTVRPKAELLANMQNICISIAKSHPEIVSIYLGTEDGIMLTYDDSTAVHSKSTRKMKYYNYKDSSWYKQGKEMNRAVYTTSYNDTFGRGVVITCVSPFYDAKGEFAGCVALDIHTEEVYKSIVSGGIVEPDLAYLIDNSGNILAEKGKVSTEHDNENVSTTTHHPELQYISSFLYKDDKKHGVEFWVDEDTGTEYFLAFANIVDVDWDLVIKSPLTEVLGPVNEIENEIDDNTSRMAMSVNRAIKSVIGNCLFLFAVLLIIIIVAVRKESDKMTRPVKILDRDVKKISRGNLHYRSKVNTDDEIGNLATAFNSMTESMEKYVSDLQEATAREERTASELALATSIQAHMLPDDFDEQKKDSPFDIFATMTPAKEVAGDFYDFYRLDEDHIALVMADVSGKGVPAALFMMITKILIKTNAHTERSPGELFRLVNNQLCDNNKEDMFTTAWMGIIDLKTGHVVSANAGHEYPALKTLDSSFQLINDVHGMPLGVVPDAKYTEYEFDISDGCVIFSYTDGVAEATNVKEELFGTDRMLAALNTKPDADPHELLDIVKHSIDTFVGDAEQFDDITMMAFKYLGKAVDVNESVTCKVNGALVMNGIIEKNRQELTVDADVSELDTVLDFINEYLEEMGCNMALSVKIGVACEEIFINIANYAYKKISPDKKGDARIIISQDEKLDSVQIMFRDKGIPYDPLKKEDPDITLGIEEREIGGLGIFMVKKAMDQVLYERDGDENVLMLIKNIR